MLVSASGMPPCLSSLESERKSAPMSRASVSWWESSSKGMLWRKSRGGTPAERDVEVEVVECDDGACECERG